MSKGVVCLTCRQVFDIAPKQCPSCNRTTFVLFKEEDPNSVCEELLFVAALTRMGFDQLELNRSAVTNIPVSAAEKSKAAGEEASTSAIRKYRIA